MSYDPRDDVRMPAVPNAMFTEEAVDRLQAMAFAWGGALGFVCGLIVAAVFFTLG